MSKTKVRVEVRNGDITKALKLLKRKSMDSGHLQEVRDRKQFIKPKMVRRIKKQKAIRANKLRIMNENNEI